ncbi:MAG: hypothetical protein RI947_1460 [Candidatus Parcubacteria bacterium]|jgi:hypothetical protein
MLKLRKMLPSLLPNITNIENHSVIQPVIRTHLLPKYSNNIVSSNNRCSFKSQEEYLRIKHDLNTSLSIEDMKWIDLNIQENKRTYG